MLKLFTFVSTNPALLELQYNSFLRHMKEPFEFIVINNGALTDHDKYIAIVEECMRLELRFISVMYDPALADRLRSLSGHRVLVGNQYANMTAACGYGVAWAWENVISKQRGTVCLMHHDMLMVRDAVLSDQMEDADLVFVPQSREGVPVHLWEGFVLANIDRLPAMDATNWWYGEIGGVNVDVGGMSHYWFQAHPHLRWKGILTVPVDDTPDVNFHPAVFEHLRLDGEPTILHYRAASDWMKQGPEYHEKKMLWLREQLR